MHVWEHGIANTINWFGNFHTLSAANSMVIQMPMTSHYSIQCMKINWFHWMWHGMVAVHQHTFRRIQIIACTRSNRKHSKSSILIRTFLIWRLQIYCPINRQNGSKSIHSGRHLVSKIWAQWRSINWWIQRGEMIENLCTRSVAHWTQLLSGNLGKVNQFFCFSSFFLV